MDWRRTTRPARGSDIWGVIPNPDAGKEAPKRRKGGRVFKILIFVLAISIIAAAITLFSVGYDLES